MFAERLKTILVSKGITQKTLLEDLSLGKNQFSYWSKTGATPNGFTVERIAEYLDVSVDYLLGKTDIIEKAPAKSESIFTEAEIAIIKMYRALDDAGKLTIGTALKREYDRIKRAEGLVPSAIAARSADGSETVHTEYMPDFSEIPADDTDL